MANKALSELLKYINKTIDLTRKNRLLWSGKRSKIIDLKITLKSFISKYGNLDNLRIELPYQKIIAQDIQTEEIEKKISVGIPKTNVTGEKLLTILTEFRLNNKRFLEEHGTHILYLTVGRIRWGKLNEEYDAPLLLVPIKITEEKSPKKIIISTDIESQDIEINPSLLLLLKTQYKISNLKLNITDETNWLDAYNGLISQLKKISGDLNLDFEISNDIRISQYFFLGQQIYSDLINNTDAMLKNEFIKSLCDNKPIIQSDLDIATEDKDKFLRENTDFNVLDADASQIKVVELAINNKNLIVQGPPGTGKSQTIVNIISNLIARNKKVLVICEKMVALQVVYDRLKSKGLDKLCLPLFSNKFEKKDFAKSILENKYDLIQMSFDKKSGQISQQLNDRTKKINILTEYAEILGVTILPLSKNLHWVYNEFSKYQDAKNILWKGKSALNITSDDYLDIMRILKEMSPIHNEYIQNSLEYWDFINRDNFVPNYIQDINNIARDLKNTLENIKDLTESIPNISIYKLQKIISLIDKNNSVWQINTQEIDINSFNNIKDNFREKYSNFLRYLYPDYYYDINRLKELCKKTKPQSYKEYLSVIETVDTIFDAEKNYKILFLEKPLRLLKNNLEAYNSLKDLLNSLLGSEYFISKSEKLSLYEYISELEHFISMANNAKLGQWINYQKYLDKLLELKLDWLLNEIKNSPYADISAIFAKSLWTTWLQEFYKQYKILKNFDAKDHQNIIKDFINLEEISIEKNSIRILEAYGNKLKANRSNVGPEETMLIHQSQIKARHKPIRKLVQETGSILIENRPCWMITPSALSSFIPQNSIEFDVVIFDEASQMRVEYALAGISRAKQVIIFGDENQLPPTNFFNSLNNQDEDDEESDFNNDYDSLLNAAKKVLPGADCMLTYHYRSKYEDLIAFSNNYIYNNRLTTFPNNKNKKGVTFEFVENGMFDGGKTGTGQNIEEAKRVIEICAKKVREYPNKSIGIISFSKSQEAAIRSCLSDYLKANSELREALDENSEKEHPFFIKNLESVQGDERDIIILSIGYSKDKKTGEVHNRFGPINSKNGYRRLNVAVTRAKEEIICVSSMKFNEIKQTDNKGVYLLQKYLEYAETGNLSLSNNNTKEILDLECNLEEEIEKALLERGYLVDKQIGVSGFKIDLAVIDPNNKNEYILGIECDGPSYYKHYSARMNDRIKNEILERLGWKIYRVWSQNWISNKQEVLDNIINKISQIK